MIRRALLASLGSAAAVASLPARAQPGQSMRRLGILMTISASEHPGLAALRDGLAELGWVEGRTLHIDLRSTDAHADRAPALAKELVALRPDALIGQALAGAAALKRATGTIPIVGVAVADPVAFGLVSNVARPEANVTAFANFEPSIGGKWLELLKEVAPGLKRVGFIFNPATSTVEGYLQAVEAAAPTFGLEVIRTPVHGEADIARVIGALGAAPGAGLIVPPDVFLTTNTGQVVGLAEKHRLPVVYAYRRWIDHGGLMVYGIDITDLYRRTALYVDRILKGARAADLPVQYPTKFEFVVNLKTARQIGLTVPRALLARADEVIERRRRCRADEIAVRCASKEAAAPGRLARAMSGETMS